MASTSKVNGCLGLGISEKDAVSMAKRAEKYSLGSEAANYAAAANDMLVELQNRRFSIQAAIDEAVKPAEKADTKEPAAPVDVAPSVTEPVGKPDRQYNLISVNEKTGDKTTLTKEPMSHASAVTMMGKFDDKPGRRVQLEETDIAPESANASTEQAEDFVKTPDGSIDFGEITAEMSKAMRRQAGKIRLQQGNADFGLKHIESRRGEQIRKMGFADVASFVSDALKNIDAIWKPDATSQLVIVQTQEKGRAVFIQLKPGADGDFYTVNTAFPIGGNFAEKKDGWVSLWSRVPVPAADTGKSDSFAAPADKSGQQGTVESNQSEDLSLSPAAPEVKEQGFTPDDVVAAERQALAAAQAAIDKMKADAAQRFASRFLPTMGVKVPVGKARINAAMADPKINLLAASSELGVDLSKSVKDALQAKQEGRVADVAEQKDATLASPTATPLDRIRAGIFAQDSDRALWARITDGTATADEFKAGFENWVSNKDQIIEALAAENTKDELFKLRGSPFYDRYKSSTKAEIVDSMWRDGANRYVLARSFSHGMGKNAWIDGVRRMVDNTDADQLAQYAQQVKANTEEAVARVAKIAEAIKDPQTLDDYITLMRSTIRGGKTFKESRMMLTPEQRAKYDELAAIDSRSKRKSTTDTQRSSVAVAGQLVDGNIIATKHTQKKHDLFVVQLAERVSKEDYDTLNSGAKRIGGYYSSYRGAGAVPGFTFTDRAQAEAFVKLAQGDNADAQAAAQANRDAFEDDRSQSATQRLTEMADRLEGMADASLNQERKANTNKRAQQAASAEAAANADKAMAKTMRNLAEAISNGTAKFLDRVRQKVQVSMLQGYVATAKGEELRAKYQTYSEQERHKGEAPTIETADFAEFPTYTASRSNLASLARQLTEVDGSKLLGQKLLKEADDVTDAYLDFAKVNLLQVSAFRANGGGLAAFGSKAAAEESISRSGYKGKAIAYQVKRGQHIVILSPSEAIERGIWQGDGDTRITLTPEIGAELVEKIGKAARRGAKVAVPWQLETAHDRRKALTRMGIETPAEFRAALREFIGLQEQAQAPNKVKELERAMVGRRNDGMDFFPTPESVADEMVTTAGIEPGMAVLEPSAGWGHIAERIRAAGVDPDVGEMSNDRRELLEAKGFRVVGRDFMEFNPRDFFTYGDTFRAKDGTEGVMRGLGGLGSNRVRLVVNGDESTATYHDRDDLTGITKNGSESGYDRIIMNPPFSDGRDIQHVQHAYTLLKPGGRIVAIMGESAFTNQNKRATDFREWLESVGGTEEKLAEGTFNDPSLPVNSGANARMVVIEKAPDAPAFSRKPNAGKPGHLSTTAVKTITKDIANRWENAPTIIVVQDMNDPAIPERVRKQDAQQRSQGAAGDPEGFFFGNKVYIVANQMTSVSDVARVLHHETLGHFGLRGAFGKNLAPILKQIATLRKADVTAKAAEYGLDMNKPNEVLQAAEEVLAEWAQTKPEMGFVKRAVAAIRQALRALGLNLRLTDEDIIASYLLPARGFVERARRAQGSSAGRLAFSLGGVDLDQQFQETAEAAGGPEAYAAAYQDGKTVLSYRQWVQVRTPSFKKWWGYDWESKQLSSGSSGADGQRKNSGRDSGVDGPIAREFTFIDESTKEPRLFYHGTRDAFTVFDADSEGKKDHGWLGRGHYVSSDHWVASHYSQNKKGAGDSVVMELFVRPNNPKYFTQKQKSAMSRANLFQVRKLTQEWRDQGHNGAALHAEDGPIELSVYDNNGLKSATSNTGLFSEAGDILFSRSLDSRTDTAQSQDFKQATANLVHDVLKTSQRMNWWKRTIGTQYHKAQTNAEFKKVFDLSQSYISGTSAFANNAANLAKGILPQLETMADLKKEWLSDKDRVAIAGAIFEGTLNYARNADGEVVESDDVGTAGVVWTAAELKDRFKLDDKQIKLYQEFRAAIAKSLSDMVVTDALKYLGKDIPADLKRMAIDNPELVRQAIVKLVGDKADAAGKAWMQVQRERRDTMKAYAKSENQRIEKIKGPMERGNAKAAHLEEWAQMEAAWDKKEEKAKQARDNAVQDQRVITDKFDKIDSLIARGYAPLTRFGKYSVTVRASEEEASEVRFFGLFESEMEANKAARQMAGEGVVTQGMLSEESYKLFSGVAPDTLEIMGEAVGMDVRSKEMFDAYIKMTKNQRSTMKRLLKRKGVPGFSQDVTRVLASFLTSNARASSANLYLGDATRAASQIREGDVKDEAVKLTEYIKNPQEEAQKIRGLLFANFLGGSIASAMVNMTQPFTMTLPYLSQFSNPAKASALLVSSMKKAVSSIDPASDLGKALRRAESDGIVSPQEIHQLQAEVSKSSAYSRRVRKASFLWGSMFSLAEQFNRRVTFIAAYEQAKADGKDAFAFAENAVNETQGIYNKANKPNWARGAVGGTIFTFKQYSISYMEFLKRLPRREQVFALAILMLAAGAEGLPFGDDLDDLIDTFGQKLGYNWNSKREKREFLAETLGFGPGLTEVLLRGVSATGLPIDVSSRMGLSNLIPGTGMLLDHKTDHSKDIAEILGPVGSLGNQALAGAGKLLGGDVVGAGKEMAPLAIQNFLKAKDMMETGAYRDKGGRKVTDTDTADAIIKGIGFQPANVAEIQRKTFMVSQDNQLAKAKEKAIADRWANAKYEGDAQGQEDARQEMIQWNERNPEARIRINIADIIKRVRTMKMDKNQRTIKQATPEMRAYTRDALQ